MIKLLLEKIRKKKNSASGRQPEKSYNVQVMYLTVRTELLALVNSAFNVVAALGIFNKIFNKKQDTKAESTF